METEQSRFVQWIGGILILMALFFPYLATAFIRDTLIRKNNSGKTDVLNAGFIDLVSSGQVSASARLIRLRIGEPDKFSLPFTIYSGVSNNAFPAQVMGMAARTNEHLVAQFITPLSGLLNFSIDGWKCFGKQEKITQAGFIYQLGERLLTGYRTTVPGSWLNGRPHNFLNSFTNGIYSGYSLGFGLEISYTVHLKAQVYRYDKPPEPVYSLPLYQFSFNYALQGKN
ncbi:MAG: hypothetical protein LW624_05200 [Terrimonas sp.]|nr:hypothetical protein [Terrimonas sp.]